MNILYIVVPCYNEEEVLPETSKRLTAKLCTLIEARKIASESRILFVDDGSRDGTWQLIAELHEQNGLIEGLKLTRNRGHQNALLAGLMTAKDRADVTISMDADLQDDIDAVDRFLEEYDAGCDIVYGVRNNRDTDTAFKRGTAQMFYKLMEAMGAKTVYNHADYRLMSRRALEGLAEFGEVNLFLRGIVPMIGYKTAVVEYSRGNRFAGESKYPLSKMINFAIDGITSLSVKPIRMLFFLGLLLLAAGGIWGICLLVLFLTGRLVHGTTVVLMGLCAATGLQLAAIGVIGEYIGKIYLETKQRPRYRIEQLLIHE